LVLGNVVGLAPGPLVGLPTAVASIAGAIVGLRLGLRAAQRAYDSVSNVSTADAEKYRAVADDGDFDASQLTGGTGLYVRVLSRALAAPGWVLSAAAVLLVGSWALYAEFGKGVEFFPSVEPEQAPSKRPFKFMRAAICRSSKRPNWSAKSNAGSWSCAPNAANCPRFMRWPAICPAATTKPKT
jgi:hypothetical protein